MRSRLTTLLVAIATLLISVPAAAEGPSQEYVVVLNPTNASVADAAREIAGQHQGKVGFVYTTALQGFTITVPEQAAIALEQNPQVAYVEPVHQVEAVGTQPIPTGIDRIEGDVNPPSPPMSVDIAILDTGVYIGTNTDGSARSHLDLNLRYVSDCSQALFYPLFGGCSGSGDFQDYNGHGTHVAGIAAALDNDIGSIGTAPGATLWSYKVLGNDGTGTSGNILAGIDAVTGQAGQIEVANMSLGFVGYSQAINDAIANSTDAGVTWVVAAGNDGIPAADFSPANSPDVITVSALADFDGLPGGLGSPTCRSDVDDTLADFSNYGPDVEIAAPGVCIFSTHLQDGYATYSGTSMASPAVAGAVARYIAETGAPTDNRADVNAIKAAVIGAGVPQTSACGFTDIDNSPEPLLFVNGSAFGGDGTCGGAPAPPGNTAPVADFSYECSDLTCDFTDLSSDVDGTIVSHSWDFGGEATSSLADPTHTFANAGSYSVQLTVTDDDGDPGVTSQTVTVTDAPPPNQSPEASFTHSCTDLDCTFTNTSSDPNGDPLGYVWDFGDESTSTASNPTHPYASAGEYTVTLTASDGALEDVATATFTVSEPSSSTTVTAAAFYFQELSEREQQASIGVFDDLAYFVPGATVEIEWTYLDRNGREKTTSSSGVSSDVPLDGLLGNVLIDQRFPPNSNVVEFCVTSVTAEGYEYVATESCAGPLPPA
jgi:PKD repeat protein